MAERKERSRAIRLPALQHASLQAMGLSVPWIVSADVPRAESIDQNARPDSRRDTPAGSEVRDELRAANQQSPVPNVRSVQPEFPGAGQRTGTSRKSAPETTSNRSGGVEQKVVESSPENRLVREREIASMDLDGISRLINACEACTDLCRTRKHPVPGQGAFNPRVMVIGEAPGEMEDLKGLPFVGRSGELLDNMLAAIGLSRTDSVFVANTIKCRPPANRNPRQDEIAACKPFLRRQIELLQPEVILAVGLFAAQSLLGLTEGVQALRQREHHLEMAGRKIPVVVTFHPAYLLRRPEDKYMAWQDLKQLWALLQISGASQV